MPNYIPSPRDWVREQVELYESSGGTKGTTLRDTGLPVIIVTHKGNKTGAIRKTPLMRVKDGDSYVLVGSQGGAPKDPVWVHNLRANPSVELRDDTVVRPMKVREVKDKAERDRLWKLAVAVFPPYAEYQAKTTPPIPVFSPRLERSLRRAQLRGRLLGLQQPLDSLIGRGGLKIALHLRAALLAHRARAAPWSRRLPPWSPCRG